MNHELRYLSRAVALAAICQIFASDAKMTVEVEGEYPKLCAWADGWFRGWWDARSIIDDGKTFIEFLTESRQRKEALIARSE